MDVQLELDECAAVMNAEQLPYTRLLCLCSCTHLQLHHVQSCLFSSTKTTAPKHTPTVHGLLAVDQSASKQNQTNPPPSSGMLSFEEMLSFQSLK